jgi:hypothetical protein
LTEGKTEDLRRTFEIGNKALVLDETKNDELKDRWLGPYRIVGKVSQNTYLLEGREGVRARPINARR